MNHLLSLSALALLFTGCEAEKAAPEPAPEPAEKAAEPAPPAAEKPAAVQSSATDVADVKWNPINPEKPEGPHMTVVRGNPKEGAFIGMAKFPAGHNGALHSHPASFAGVTISGTVLNGRSAEENVEIGPGSAWTEPAGEVHYTGCADGADCIFAAYMDGALGMIPAEAAAEGDLKMVYTAADAIPFEPINPKKPEGPKMFVVSGDKATGPFQAIVSFPGGAAAPEHSHSSTYSAIVLAGKIGHGGDTSHGPGSHWTNPGGENHVTACVSEEPCMFFASMDGGFDMTPVKPPEAPADAAAE